MRSNYFWGALAIIILCLSIGRTSPEIYAATIDELKNQINNRTQQIKALEEEIVKYRTKLGASAQKSKTLSGEITRLETEIAKLNADIRLTEAQISTTELQIEELSANISEQESIIEKTKAELSGTLRTMHQEEASSFIEIFLQNGDISNFLTNLHHIESVDASIKTELEKLKELKQGLEVVKSDEETKRNELKNYELLLGDQKSLSEGTIQEKNTLLVESKNEESAYQFMINARQKLRETIQNEIAKIEDQLRKAINPKALPSAGRGILGWPLKGHVVLTQSFGNTPESQILYNGKPHNGIDLAAQTGTPVYSAEKGIVLNIGDTDQYPGCLSYGKWVAIKHQNNLTTLYAHLSLIKVSKGESVDRGALIGYSGATGYATGPHLHFTVYDSSTVQFRSSTLPGSGCKFLPYGGYVNPMAYL